MSNIKYVIRHNDFGYNDEWFMTDEVTLGAIKAIYTDKAEAEQAYKALVIHALYHDNDLCQFDICNGYAEEGVEEKIEAFILEKTGEEFDGESLPEMNDDDAFEFAKLSGVLHYQLLEVDDCKPNYVVFLPQNNQYVHAETPSNSIILTTHSDNPLFDYEYEHEYFFEQTLQGFFDELPQSLNGALSDLTDSPTLLQEFISAKNLSYDEQQLHIGSLYNKKAFDSLKALNALLKQPLFEIRQITLEELATLD